MARISLFCLFSMVPEFCGQGFSRCLTRLELFFLKKEKEKITLRSINGFQFYLFFIF